MISPNCLFDLLSDETRLRCTMLLLEREELCVCELCQALESTQPKISRHLAIMRTSGLISDERRGQWIYYRLNPQLDNWVKILLDVIFTELKKIEPYRSDLKRTKALCKQNLCS